MNRERGRETEFEEILGYHLEQAYRYRTELGVIDDEARGVGPGGGQARQCRSPCLDRGDLPAAVGLLRRAIGAVLPGAQITPPHRAHGRPRRRHAPGRARLEDAARGARAQGAQIAAELGEGRAWRPA